MTVGRVNVFAGALALPLIVAPAAKSADHAYQAFPLQRMIQLAQAPAPEEEKKKREQKGQEKGPSPAPKGQPQQPPKAEPQPSPKAAPTTPTPPLPPKGPSASPPTEKNTLPPAKGEPPAEKKSLNPTVPPSAPPAAKVPSDGKTDIPKQVIPGPPSPGKAPTALPKETLPPSTPVPGSKPDLPKGAGQPPEGKKDIPKQVVPGQPSPGKAPTASPKEAPPTTSGTAPVPGAKTDVPKAGTAPEGKKDMPKSVAPGQPSPAPDKASPPAQGATPPAGAPPVPPAASVAPPHLQRAPQTAAPAPRFDQVQKGRQERVEEGGRRTVIQEPGNRVIVKQDNRIIIQHDDSERFRRIRDAKTERRPDGAVETFYMRPDGFRVVTEVDANGRLVRRYRRGPDGREYGIIDNRRFLRNTAIGIGIGAIGVAIALNLPPPTVTIPRERYIVDYERASDEDLYETLSAPPVDRLERSYSLEEVRYNYELRERMRRIDLDAITFASGAFEVAPEEFPKLERLARIILRVLDRNPDEVLLVEGHTDAVGSDVDNLSLSDRRAEAVAQILTETFGVPPENLVTQGYGEQYLKISTPGPERANRRVAVRRITPLMSER
jgi:outer membrane protein OmpA-like peptidoglycan-associated protein